MTKSEKKPSPLGAKRKGTGGLLLSWESFLFPYFSTHTHVVCHCHHCLRRKGPSESGGRRVDKEERGKMGQAKRTLQLYCNNNNNKNLHTIAYQQTVEKNRVKKRNPFSVLIHLVQLRHHGDGLAVDLRLETSSGLGHQPSQIGDWKEKEGKHVYTGRLHILAHMYVTLITT